MANMNSCNSSSVYQASPTSAAKASVYAVPVALVRPNQKMVIGLSAKLPGWVTLCGDRTEWIDLAPNPAFQNNPAPQPTHNDADAPAVASGAGDDRGGGVMQEPKRSNVLREPMQSPKSKFPMEQPFHCDTCQRGFPTSEKYEEHMATHIYCTVPGCHFTCRGHRPERMQEHMDTLHNRPDAPNLLDTGAYVEQRKRRYPTQEVVKEKVEELYYKAARGVLLPGDRTRWMRQHGIDIRKRPNAEASFIARGALPEGKTSPHSASQGSASIHASASGDSGSPDSSRSASSASAQSDQVEKEEAVSAQTVEDSPHPALSAVAAAVDPVDPVPSSARVEEAVNTTHSPAAARLSAGGEVGHRSASTKIIPLGPNGTLTPRQRVQLVRERYASAKEVPLFYVCHRCGRKGEHWVADCPTKGDAVFDRHLVWGEARLSTDGKGEAGQQRKRERADGAMDVAVPSDIAPSTDEIAEEKAEEGVEEEMSGMLTIEEDVQPSQTEENVLKFTENVQPTAPAEEDEPPVPQSAAAALDAPKEVTRVWAPVAAARRVQPRRDYGRKPPPPPTLYERLTEEERLTEQGVLLQSLRFFVARNFFADT